MSSMATCLPIRTWRRWAEQVPKENSRQLAMGSIIPSVPRIIVKET